MVKSIKKRKIAVATDVLFKIRSVCVEKNYYLLQIFLISEKKILAKTDFFQSISNLITPTAKIVSLPGRTSSNVRNMKGIVHSLNGTFDITQSTETIHKKKRTNLAIHLKQ